MPRLVQHMHRQRQGGGVQHFQRPHRHARHHSGMLDQRSRHTFGQQSRTFHHERAKHTAGEKPARIVHDDRRFANRQHVVVGSRQCFIAGQFAFDDLDQFHFVDRRKKMQAHKLFRPGTGRGQPSDWQGGCVGCKYSIGRQHGFSFLRDLRFQPPVFKHSLNDQVTGFQVLGVVRGLNQCHGFELCTGLHAVGLHQLVGQLLRVVAPLLGFFQTHIFQHTGDAARGIGMGDARTHHACAQDAHANRLPGFKPWRSRFA